MPRSPRRFALFRCARAIAWCALLLAANAHGVTLAAKAKAEGCTGPATVVQGTNLYKCRTQGGMHYFNLEAPSGEGAPAAARGGSASPQGFPKVDAATQKGRDSVRRKVLTDELAIEEKALADAKAAYGDGAPPPTAEEKEVPHKYAERVAKLRQAVALHGKNVEALKKELAATR
jgi:hypothetical protein